MTFWLRILSDLIPLFISVILLVAGAYCPLIYRSERVMLAYVVTVVALSMVSSVIWVNV